MIKIGIRHNLFYPVMLIVFIGLRKIVEILLLDSSTNYGKYLLPFLIFFSKFLAGLIAQKNSQYILKSDNRNTIAGFKLIHSRIEVPKVDKMGKILLLIFFASYFDIIGTMIRKHFKNNDLNNNFIEERLKSFQIFTSALLCYLTIRIKMYKHNIFCLIIIFICLIIIIIFELTHSKGLDIKFISITIFSASARAFLDTIEKYLFEFDNISPFKMMMFEGFINTILTICLFLFDNSPIKEKLGGKTDSNSKSESISNQNSYSKDLAYLIILLIFYFIFSAFKNIYRVTTIKFYSPMTRALAETILDPIILIYSLINNIIDIKNDPNNNPNNYNNIWSFGFHFGINIFLSIIMAFCSCVYNDFIVLYCCGLEHDTYLEVSKRCLSIDENFLLPEENSSSSDEEEDGAELKTINNNNNNSSN